MKESGSLEPRYPLDRGQGGHSSLSGQWENRDIFTYAGNLTPYQAYSLTTVWTHKDQNSAGHLSRSSASVTTVKSSLHPLRGCHEACGGADACSPHCACKERLTRHHWPFACQVTHPSWHPECSNAAFTRAEYQCPAFFLTRT
jgi:hypothetical protein